MEDIEMNLSPQMVREYAKFMFDSYRLKPRYKRSSWEMIFLNFALSRLGITEKDEWLNRYATILGQNVYLPFVPGTMTKRWDLKDQVACIAHECQHGFQMKKEGSSKWNYLYFSSSAKRSNYEADAYSTSLEVYHYLGVALDPVETAKTLFNYGCKKDDVETVKLRLVLFERLVQKGGYSTNAGVKAIKYLIGRDKR
jgi:hypothetical protein